MRRAHREKLRLCDTLEQLADALPHVDRLQCLGVANSIVPLLRAIHRYEETVVFRPMRRLSPWLSPILPPSDGRAEHLEDECYAEELTEDRECESGRLHAARLLRKHAAPYSVRARAHSSEDRTKRLL
ncbi:hemerythrin domain-containing protein [Mesorhizobium sp. WSM4898]|uniref:hemerythrin domain-containing protein n=1 Tax=Mesorhizobium sp. WSM4898 TaxID=3038544 RepID=UPI0032425058